MLRTYVQSMTGKINPAIPPVRTYTAKRRKIHLYEVLHSFHAHKAPHPPSGRVGDVVAMLQIESPGIGNHGIAEATGFQRCKGIFFAPHPVDFIEIFGADRRIRFDTDISLRFHEIKDIVVVTFDRLPVFLDSVTLCEFEVAGNKPPQSFQCPQERCPRLQLSSSLQGQDHRLCSTGFFLW